MNDAEIKPGIYRHYKGRLYRVVGIGKHTETEEDLVIYYALYGDKKIWTRPVSMWNEIVNVEGYSGPRFVYEDCIGEVKHGQDHD